MDFEWIFSFVSFFWFELRTPFPLGTSNTYSVMPRTFISNSLRHNFVITVIIMLRLHGRHLENVLHQGFAIWNTYTDVHHLHRVLAQKHCIIASEIHNFPLLFEGENEDVVVTLYKNILCLISTASFTRPRNTITWHFVLFSFVFVKYRKYTFIYLILKFTPKNSHQSLH